MGADDTYSRTLDRALEVVGDEAALATALGTKPELLSRWLSGELRPSPRVYFAALDIGTQQAITRMRGRL